MANLAMRSTFLSALVLIAPSAHAGLLDEIWDLIPRSVTGARWEKKITLEGLLQHSRKLQSIADANGGARDFGTPGYNASVDYVYHLAKSLGYQTTRQAVPFPKSIVKDVQLTIENKVFGTGEVLAFSYTPGTGGPVTAPLVYVPDLPGGQAGHGCDTADYQNLDIKGKLALVQRGTCTFALKTELALNAGAAGLILFNNVPGGPISSRLNYEVSKNSVTVMISLEDATPYVARLNGTSPDTISATLNVDASVRPSWSENVIAQTWWGDKNNVLFIGSHLDSVPAGPGINDDGSGTATVAELARTLAKGFLPGKNAVRFAWWANEEIGLIGSKYYVDSLSAAERKKIVAYTNLDMTASPNYILGIHDGDNSEGHNNVESPVGSAELEVLYQKSFDDRKLPHGSYAFTSSSDYDAFLSAGIASGGLATGAGGLKTETESKAFGGKAGVAYDECYHRFCDTIDNLSHDAFLWNAQAVARVIGDLVQNAKPIRDAKPAVAGANRLASLKSSSVGNINLGKDCAHDEL